MDFEKFTEKSRGFVQKAQTLAMRSSHQSMEPEHLLRVMLDDEDGLLRKLLQTASADIEKISKESIRRLPSCLLYPAVGRAASGFQPIYQKYLITH